VIKTTTVLITEVSVTEIPNEIEQNGTIEVISSEIENCNNTEKLDDVRIEICRTIKFVENEFLA
jgi:hypothetical protein